MIREDVFLVDGHRYRAVVRIPDVDSADREVVWIDRELPDGTFVAWNHDDVICDAILEQVDEHLDEIVVAGNASRFFNSKRFDAIVMTVHR
jgi:hypothetical protein